MKKYILIMLLIFVSFMKEVNADEEKLKVIMFNASDSISEEEALEKIKKFDGYNEKFELVILDTVKLKGAEDGTDLYNEEYFKLFKKTVDQYNEANDEEWVAHQYPTFLISNKMQVGTALLDRAIKEALVLPNKNQTYNCLLADSEYNCFNNEKIKPPKKDVALLYSLSIIIVITILMWLSLKSEKKKKASINKVFNC